MIMMIRSSFSMRIFGSVIGISHSAKRIKTSAIRGLDWAEIKMWSDVIVGYCGQRNADPCARMLPSRNLLLLHLYIYHFGIVHFTLFTVECTLLSMTYCCTLYSMYCCTLYSVYCCTLYSLYCCTLYSVYCCTHCIYNINFKCIKSMEQGISEY